jgi:hypothetical protein
MRKKILVTITVLAVIAALAAAFSGATFFKVTVQEDNEMTYGNITATALSPLISMKKLVPGEYREATFHLYPTGDIPQDIYAGLHDQNVNGIEYSPFVEYALNVDDGGWSGYNPIADLYKYWTKIKLNAASGSDIKVQLMVHIKPDLPPAAMGFYYNFKTVIYAIQVGSVPPATPSPSIP